MIDSILFGDYQGFILSIEEVNTGVAEHLLYDEIMAQFFLTSVQEISYTF